MNRPRPPLFTPLPMARRRWLQAGGWSLLIGLAPALAQGPASGQGPGPGPWPPRDPREPGREPGRRGERPRYSLEQALSEQAQLHTIAFSGLAFLSGDFEADTFLPPGKVSDYFGFQYLRDIDRVEGGHSPSFLTRIAFNLLGLLRPEQRQLLNESARSQVPAVRQVGLMRLPLMRAMRLELQGQAPAGSAGLDRGALLAHSAALYELDARIALQRAELMARVLRSLDDAQRERLGRLKFGDSSSWPEAEEPPERRQLPHEVDVLLMTLASEMFAWSAGSLEADTYFCPERHAMYFGGFGLKTAPAVGKQDFKISTALTGDAGADFLALLDERQAALLRAIPAEQAAELNEIVAVRRRIATQLRRLLRAERPDEAALLQDARRYGELDGALTWRYFQAFARIGRSLNPAQRARLKALREQAPHDPRDPKGPFLYADPLDAQGLKAADRVGPLFGQKG